MAVKLEKAVNRPAKLASVLKDTLEKTATTRTASLSARLTRNPAAICSMLETADFTVMTTASLAEILTSGPEIPGTGRRRPHPPPRCPR